MQIWHSSAGAPSPQEEDEEEEEEEEEKEEEEEEEETQKQAQAQWINIHSPMYAVILNQTYVNLPDTLHLGVLLIPGLFVLVSREGELLNDSPREFIKTALQHEAMSFRPDVPSQRIVFEVPVKFCANKNSCVCLLGGVP